MSLQAEADISFFLSLSLSPSLTRTLSPTTTPSHPPPPTSPLQRLPDHLPIRSSVSISPQRKGYQRNVSWRNYPLRHWLWPWHPRSRPGLRIRTVCPLISAPALSTILVCIACLDLAHPPPPPLSPAVLRASMGRLLPFHATEAPSSLSASAHLDQPSLTPTKGMDVSSAATFRPRAPPLPGCKYSFECLDGHG